MDHVPRVTITAGESVHRLTSGQHALEDVVESSVDDPDISGSTRFQDTLQGRDSDDGSLDALSFSLKPTAGASFKDERARRRSSDDAASYDESSSSTLTAISQGVGGPKKQHAYPPIPESNSPFEQLLKPMTLVEDRFPRQSRGSLMRQASALALQSTPSLLLSLFGLVFTGELLDRFSTWPLFVRVDEFFILVPILVSSLAVRALFLLRL